MDIARPDIARRKRRRRILLAVLLVLVLGAITLGVSRLEPPAPVVEKSAIWTGEVERGPMERAVRGTGKLVPRDVRWITATSAGRIERMPLLPGVPVTPDTLLVELSNPALDQAVYDAEAAVASAQAQLEKLSAQLESERLARESRIVSLRSDLALAEIEAQANRELLEQGFVPLLVAKRSQAVAEELRSRLAFEEQQRALHDKSVEVQLAAQRAEIRNLGKQLELKRRQWDALSVRAGVSGVLQRLGGERPLQVGQQLSAGADIALITDPSRLKAEVKIAETQARDVQPGQEAAIDIRNEEVRGHVVRVDPAVKDGTVTVDIELDAPQPKGALPDLRIDGTITLEFMDDVLYVGRPVQGHPDAEISLFRLDPDGREAARVKVRLGRSSVSRIEVLEGLQVGDVIILSDMSEWDEFERVRIR